MTVPVTIIEATTTILLKKFVRFPYKLYADNAYWAPPLDKMEYDQLGDKNPALKNGEQLPVLAMRGNEVVGRVVVLINHANNAHIGKKIGRFTWLDFIDDKEVSRAMFDYIMQWHKAKGMEEVHGPLGFTDFDYQGMLVEGFDVESTMSTIYNYPYYNTHIKDYGFTKAADWLEMNLIPPNGQTVFTHSNKIKKLAKLISERYNVSLAKIKTKKDLLRYVPQIFDLLNLAYKDLYGFTPHSPEQIQYYTDNYFFLVIRNYIPIVVDKQDRVIGFIIALPSFNRALRKNKGKLFPFGFLRMLSALRKHDRAEFYLGAVHPDFQNKGLMSLMYGQIIREAIKRGVRCFESNPVLEENTNMRNIYASTRTEMYESRDMKRRRSYRKMID